MLCEHNTVLRVGQSQVGVAIIGAEVPADGLALATL
jgi:hypothetical protein